MEIFKNPHYDFIVEGVNVDEEEWIKDSGKAQYQMWVRPMMKAIRPGSQVVIVAQGPGQEKRVRRMS